MAERSRMATTLFPDFWRKPRGLRVRVALGVAFPVLLILFLLSVIHYWRERQLIEQQIRLTSIQIGEVTLGSLRHVMLQESKPHLDQILGDVGRMESIQRVLLINQSGYVTGDSTNRSVGDMRQPTDLGCEECHATEPASRSRTAILSSSADTLRIASPIDNEAACRSCHTTSANHLGVLLIDVSLTNTRADLLKDLRADLVVSAGFTLIITAGVYLLVHWLVVRRVEQFRDPLATLASGDFNARLPTRLKPRDEIDSLASAVNHMADELAGHIKAQEERHLLRHNAIVEERERIAREIHDGVAQLLGYVNTKVAAIRMLLNNRELESAQSQLEQLATASHESFTELRTDILGLRTSDTNSTGLANTLATFVERFSELTGIRIDVDLPEDDSVYKIPSESELQLLRIAQEALSNIQKHAASNHAWVQLKVFDHTLEMTIGDNGQGFDPIQSRSDHRPHFGLSTMRERAESIGATFEVKSKSGEGTQVIVLVPLENE